MKSFFSFFIIFSTIFAFAISCPKIFVQKISGFKVVEHLSQIFFNDPLVFSIRPERTVTYFALDKLNI